MAWSRPARRLTDTNIVDTLPETLEATWRLPIHGGYAGPAVAGGRVFVTDARRDDPNSTAVVERVLALDEQTGEILWTPSGRRTTPGCSLPTRSARAPRRRSTATGCTSSGRWATSSCSTSPTAASFGRGTTSGTSMRLFRRGGSQGRRWSTATDSSVSSGASPTPRWSRSTSGPARSSGGRCRRTGSLAIRSRS